MADIEPDSQSTPPEAATAATSGDAIDTPDANDGGFTLVFSTPQTISAFHLVYHNLDPGLNVTLDPDGGTPIAIGAR